MPESNPVRVRICPNGQVTITMPQGTAWDLRMLLGHVVGWHVSPNGGPSLAQLWQAMSDAGFEVDPGQLVRFAQGTTQITTTARFTHEPLPPTRRD